MAALAVKEESPLLCGSSFLGSKTFSAGAFSAGVPLTPEAHWPIQLDSGGGIISSANQQYPIWGSRHLFTSPQKKMPILSSLGRGKYSNKPLMTVGKSDTGSRAAGSRGSRFST